MKQSPIRLCILGSTGSIGTQTLDVVREHPERFTVVGLSAHANAALFEKQISEFKPRYSLCTKTADRSEDQLEALARMQEADTVVIALPGSAGLGPLLSAVRAGKRVAVANKEALVIAGPSILELAAQSGAEIVPIDSELTGIWSLLRAGKEKKKVEKIILTASGGPFWNFSRTELQGVTVAQALQHPTWNMGKKICIDSATLVNKGFEVIAASILFQLPPEKIEVVIHRQSVVHAMCQYEDGSVEAAMSVPDMRIAIAAALSGGIISLSVPRLDFSSLQLSFEKLRSEPLRGVALAYEALRQGGLMPAIFCMGNDIAVEKFLRGDISFLEIYDVIRRVMDGSRGHAQGEISRTAVDRLKSRILELV